MSVKLPFRKLLFLSLFFLFASALVSAQSAKQFLEKGNQRFEMADYYGAAEILNQGAELYTDNLEIRFLLAESYRHYNDYETAAESYKNILTDDKDELFPTARFWYASMLKQLGKYNEALKQFEKYKIASRGRTELAAEITREVESAKWAKENQAKVAPIKIIHLGDDVNSVYSDFNPFTSIDNELVYSSLKKDTLKNIKESRSGFFSPDKELAKFIDKINASQSSKSIANGSFSVDFSQFFFNVCDNEIKKHCDVYVMHFNGEWSAPIITQGVNSNNATSSQPFLVKEQDGNYLYFSSDRSGTKGGMDIWRAKQIDKEKFIAPENVSAINTAKNEYSVFYDEDSNKIYFSSEGWKGFGGLDIFYYDLTCKCAPVNLGQPINSPANDFGYSLSADRTKAYFASNRKGSLFIKSQTCCYDIWMYDTGKDAKEKKEVLTVKVVDSIEARMKIDSSFTVAVTKNDDEKSIKDTLIVNGEQIANRQRDSSVQTSQNVFDIAKTKKLIPVTLYFHNDEPDCCNLSDTTNLNYATTYEAYWKLLREYKMNFAKGLDEGKKTEAEDAIFYLFTNRVEKGYSDLVQLSAQITDALNTNQKIEITIQGYCSPLNYNLYNIKLGYRRVASLINYFYNYRNGLLRPFLNDGRLVLKKESFGEETAPSDVSDSREDTQNSVYNPRAAIERKVEIISIEIK